MKPGDVDLTWNFMPRNNRTWYGEPNALKNAIAYAEFRSRTHDTEVRIFNEAGEPIDTKRWSGKGKRSS